MNAKRFQSGLSLILLFAAVHLLLGFYAIKDDGSIAFGLTSIERFFIHTITGDETRYTTSGSQRHFVDDVCIKECESCALNCYPQENLKVSCGGAGCRLQTPKGRVLLTENQKTYLVVKKGLIIEGSVFACQDKCFLEEKLENYSLIHYLPEGVKQD